MQANTPIVSFDLDDTLYDNTPVIRHAFAELYSYLCETYPEVVQFQPDLDAFIASAYQSRTRYPDEVDFQRVRHLHIKDCLSEAGYHHAATDTAYQVFYDARQVVTLFDDVLPTLQELNTKYTLISISNGNAEPDRIGLGTYFKTHVNPHECGYAKPDPQIYRWTCQQLAIAPEQLLHIGDCLSNDVNAALNAGARAIWFNPKGKPGFDGPQITQISDLPELLSNLLSDFL